MQVSECLLLICVFKSLIFHMCWQCIYELTAAFLFYCLKAASETQTFKQFVNLLYHLPIIFTMIISLYLVKDSSNNLRLK